MFLIYFHLLNFKISLMDSFFDLYKNFMISYWEKL